MPITKQGTIVTEITGQNTFPVKGTIPKARTFNGTFSSTGLIVTGTGTAFTTDLAGVRGWLYSTTDNELRQFFQINGDNTLYLEKAFTNNQVAQPMAVVMPLYMAVSARSSHATNAAIINNRTFSAGSVKNFSFPTVSPMTYDAATGEITFDLAY